MQNKELAKILLDWAAGKEDVGGPTGAIALDAVKLAEKLVKLDSGPEKPFDNESITRFAKDNPQLTQPNPLRRMTGTLRPPHHFTPGQ
jgi:hypothetical protein